MTRVYQERVLQMIREERARQIDKYGFNEGLLLGFGSRVSAYPWLTPYSYADSKTVESVFRADYEYYTNTHGQPTWMHLIREEVAELFDTTVFHDALEEAVQVASLCVSLCEKLLAEYEGDLS